MSAILTAWYIAHAVVSMVSVYAPADPEYVLTVYCSDGTSYTESLDTEQEIACKWTRMEFDYTGK